MSADGVDASAPAQQKRREPYMGLFRRFKLKGDDAWTLAIQWGAAVLAIVILLILVFACYFTMPKPVRSSDAGTSKFSEERYAYQNDV